VKLYSTKVRLGGSVMHEIRKDDVTPAEIAILRILHGNDAVLEITATGDTDRDDEEELDRLRAAYDEGLNAIEPRGSVTVDRLFGMAPLPDSIRNEVEMPTRRRPGRPRRIEAEVI
jgi:hypothetical protein